MGRPPKWLKEFREKHPPLKGGQTVGTTAGAGMTLTPEGADYFNRMAETEERRKRTPFVGETRQVQIGGGRWNPQYKTQEIAHVEHEDSKYDKPGLHVRVASDAPRGTKQMDMAFALADKHGADRVYIHRNWASFEKAPGRKTKDGHKLQRPRKAQEMKKNDSSVGSFEPTSLISQVGADKSQRPKETKVPLLAYPNIVDGYGAIRAAELKEKLNGIRQEILDATEEKREDEQCDKCGAAGHDVDKCWMGKSLRQQAEINKAERRHADDGLSDEQKVTARRARNDRMSRTPVDFDKKGMYATGKTKVTGLPKQQKGVNLFGEKYYEMFGAHYRFQDGSDKGKGTSEVGHAIRRVNRANDKGGVGARMDRNMAVSQAKEKLEQIRSMKKPDLPKSKAEKK